MSNVHWLAWREILAELLEGVPSQENVAPPWLVNPETKRQLTLDVLYPDLGLAVHFRGARPAAQRRRLSDVEVAAAERREQIRRELCRAHGITLVTIDLQSEEPRRALDALYTALSRVTRELAHSSREDKVEMLERVARARRLLEDIRARVRRPEDLDVFADKWRDREARLIREARTRQEAPPPPRRRYRVGMRVHHERFGEGRVVAVEDEANGDQRVTIDFPTAGQRTFLASLVGEKLRVK